MIKKISVILLATGLSFAGITTAEAKKVNTRDCSITHVSKKPLGKKALAKKAAKGEKVCKAKKAKS